MSDEKVTQFRTRPARRGDPTPPSTKAEDFQRRWEELSCSSPRAAEAVAAALEEANRLVRAGDIEAAERRIDRLARVLSPRWNDASEELSERAAFGRRFRLGKFLVRCLRNLPEDPPHFVISK
jgi:hypothetical protein